MVISAFIQALHNVISPDVLFYTFLGSVIGLFNGFIPAVGGLVGLALVVPFVFKMTPAEALPVMVSLTAVCYTAGSMTAILLNVPGTEPNAATLIDGYPMAQKGEAGRAIGAALMSSAAGGVAAVFLALAMVPLLIPMIMAIRSADMVFIILLGIAFIAVLTRDSMLKGLMSGAAGLLISLIGWQSVTGAPRFTFGSVYLYDGIGLIPIIIGLFALPEAMALATKGGTIAEAHVELKGMKDVWVGARDVFRHRWLWLRSTVVGYVVGVIPGMGAAAAVFVAYGQAKAVSKHPEIFGTGCVEGVIAPESANNAKEAGSLLTTLALGIPGSASGAILLGAFMLLGLTPGPGMMTRHLDLSLTLLLCIIVANIIAVAICFGIAPQIVKVVHVPSRILAPLIIVVALVGTYSYQEQIYDVVTALVFTLVGLAMRNYNYNRPALLLGFILGSLFEKYLFIAYAANGPLFFKGRPISWVLIAAIIALLTYGPIKSRFGKGAKKV